MRKTRLLFLTQVLAQISALSLIAITGPVLAQQSEIQTLWLSSENSITRQIGDATLKEPNLPTEQTRVLTKIDIDIRQGRVTKRVKRMNYYPSFNETNNAGSDTIYWDRELENLTILEAGVVSAEAGYQRLNMANVRINDSNTYNTFGDQKEVILPFSGLRDRSVTVLEYELEFSLNQLESNWAEVYYPVSDDIVRKFQLKVTADASFDLNWSNSHQDIKCQLTSNELECTGSNLQPYMSDTNVVWRDVMGQIFVGESLSWNDVIDNSLNAFNKSEIDSPLVAKELDRLVESDVSFEEKIVAIQDFVSRDIRYVSMSELGHRITPHTFESVLHNRFGDCKDKSAVLVGLLRKAGVDAYPVLIATERSSLYQVRMPSTGYFDHMVVCFSHDKKFRCLDPTDNSTSWTSVSSWIHGRIALPLVTGSRPFKIPSGKAKWQMTVDATSTFSKEGRLAENQTRTYLGNFAGSWRSVLTAYNDKERQDWAVNSYQSTVSSLVEPSFEFENLEPMSDSLIIKSSADYDSFLSIESNLNYTERDAWVYAQLSSATLENKYYDERVDGFDIQSNNVIDFGALWKVQRIPAELTLKSEFGSLVRTVERLSRDKIKIKTKAKVFNQKISKNNIEIYNKFIAQLLTHSSYSFGGELLK